MMGEMDQKLNFILYAQAHLSSGTSEAEFEALYETEIKPLISALDKFPRINMLFHYSGVILYWIERHHPEFFMLIEDLLSRKQAEFLGGGFYDPALTLLPLTDKIGQIDMLTTYLRKHFGKKPQGCWLPSMAWEQNLVVPLTSCGMNYTFLEDLQFLDADITLNGKGVYYPCITEDQGKLITVFPVFSTTGKRLLEEKPMDILGELLEKLPQSAESPAMVFPVMKTEYDNLFAELSKADSRIRFTCPSKIYKSLHSLRKIYFPGAWASASFLANEANPRQILADYPEAGGIYAKMIHVHTLINNQLRGDKTRKKTALEELWKAQDSGIYSLKPQGLCHAPLRNAAYHSLLEAEKIIREKEKLTPSLSVFDFDLDGTGEYIFQDDKLNYFIKSHGAGIFELDYLPCAWNYLDTMAPRLESSKSEKRCSFVDWLAPPETLPEDLKAEGIKGGRFCGKEEYEATDTDRLHRRVVFSLPQKTDLRWGEIEIGKTWQLKKNSLALEYMLKNSGTKITNFVFSTSIDFSFSGEGERFLRVLSSNLSSNEGEKENIPINEGQTIRNVKTLEFQDLKNETLINLESSRSFDGRIFPVRSGFSGQEEYQSTCLMTLLPVSLEAGKTWKASFSLKISS